MEWDVLLDDDFAAWLDGLDAALEMRSWLMRPC